tara:strand:+ start:146 stop:547 length:402 start_codon:yes stop_codon:yes gene_type:complete
MRFKTLTGGLKRLSRPHRYKIDWAAPSRSKIQYKVKRALKESWENHVVFEEFPVAGTKMTLDFYNANKKIAIEVQGRQHTKYVPHFHGNNKINYISQLRRDNQKREFCEINGIRLIEIHEGDEISKRAIESVI